jgi:hypothetical protein
MRTWTLQEFRDKIELEHDLQEESFISSAEMINYINEGIDWAESVVIGQYEDYYLDRTDWLELTPEADLPTYIYANKFRKVEVSSGNSPIAKGMQIFKNSNLSDNHVGYNIYHRHGQTPKIVFENIPDSYKYYRLTFIRNANRVVGPSDIIDLPEIAMYHAQQFVKIRCYQKEKDPMLFKTSEEIQQMTQVLNDTLSNITNDGSDQIQMDTSFYNEFDFETDYY